MTIANYLKYYTGFPIKDNNVEVIVLGRNASISDQVIDLTTQTKELLQADTLMFVAGLPSAISGSVKKSGDFEIREGNTTLGNRDSLVKRAMAIYLKYDDAAYDAGTVGTTVWVE